jgi:hypothetical protein
MIKSLSYLKNNASDRLFFCFSIPDKASSSESLRENKERDTHFVNDTFFSRESGMRFLFYCTL